MTTQGKRLKKIRQHLGLSQEEFGKILNVSKQYVSNLEADRNILNNEKLVKLAVGQKVSVDYLIVGTGEMFINENADNKLDKLIDERIKKVLDRQNKTQ